MRKRAAELHLKERRNSLPVVALAKSGVRRCPWKANEVRNPLSIVPTWTSAIMHRRSLRKRAAELHLEERRNVSADDHAKPMR